MHRIYQIYFEKKKSTAWVLLGVKDETIVSQEKRKPYFRMEIFLRKVAECTDLGKCLF